MKTLIVAVALSFVCAGFVAAPKSDPKLDLIKGYRSWTRATEKVQDMPLAIARLCSQAPPPTATKPNLHASKVFLVYVNKVGKAAMMKKGKSVFPDGTVIVKEKYDRSQYKGWSEISTETVLKSHPELLTVMYKDHGKWVYFSVDSQGNRQDSDTTHCRSCHEKRKAEDYVYRPYVVK